MNVEDLSPKRRQHYESLTKYFSKTMLPRYFNGHDIDYHGAVREVIEREFRRSK